MRALLLAGLAVALAGCQSERVRPPPAPGLDGSLGEGGVRPPPVARSDAGRRDGGTLDGATADAGEAPGCTRLAPEEISNDFTITLEAETQSFPTEAAYATWDADDCDSPALLIGITDGACAPGYGRQLLLVLARDSIGTAVTTGDNPLFAEPADTALRVRYYVPAPMGEPDSWGTCPGASGTVRFDELGSLPGSRLSGSFFMTLTDCAEPLDLPPLLFEGVFDVTLEEPLSAFCP